MKKVVRIFLLAVLVSTGVAKSNEAKSQASVNASVSFSIFYNSLKPYGHWMNNSTYGKVWVCNTRDFTPYSTNGHWAYTDEGWTWVSSYDWGWAPFHYGRWSYHAKYGWYWIPGYEWAPAWVSWRNNNDYYGWAPLSPGVNISVGVSSYDNSIPYGRWVFAPRQYITSPYISRYYVPRTRNVTIIKNTTIVNNVTVRNNVRYVAGPRREDVERVNHERVQTYAVANSSRPGKTVINRNTINVYRPVVNNNDKTVVNNNNTTINKNSNNKTVNKNSNNTTKNSNNTTVNNNKTNIDNNNNKTVTKKDNNKPVNKPANETVKKAPHDSKKPVDNASQHNQAHNNNQAPQNNNQEHKNNQPHNNNQAHKAKPEPHQNASKENPQQKHDNEVAKKKNQEKKDNNPPK